MQDAPIKPGAPLGDKAKPPQSPPPTPAQGNPPGGNLGEPKQITPTGTPDALGQQQKGDMLKVDIGKNNVKKFEIHTMADDLGRSAPAKSSPNTPPPPQPKPQSSPIRPSSPPPPSPLDQTPDILFEEEHSSRDILKSFLLGFLVILLLGGAGLGAWWYFFFSPSDSVTPPAPPTPQPTPPSTINMPLIPVDRSFTVELGSNPTKADLFERVASQVATATDLLPQELIRLILAEEGTPLSVRQLQTILDVEFPASLAQDSFTLVYTRGGEGVVFGLVMRTSDSEDARAFIASREGDIPFIVNNLYTEYTKNALPQAFSNEFLENTYQGVTIRYMNFNDPNLSFDYALHEDLLIFGGSRDIMFTLIDRAKIRSILR